MCAVKLLYIFPRIESINGTISVSPCMGEEGAAGLAVYRYKYYTTKSFARMLLEIHLNSYINFYIGYEINANIM